MVKLTKKDLVAKVAEETLNTKKDVEEVVSAFLNNLSDELSFGNEIELNGFGKFEVKTRAARTGINPQTKEPVEIPETKVVGFKAAKALKDKVKGE